jgi:hypothetical protein
VDQSSNPYQAPGPDTLPLRRSRVVAEEPGSWSDVPLWRRGYVCFGTLVAMLILTVVSYASPALLPFSLALSIAGFGYSVILSHVTVYHAPLASDDGLRAWEPVEKAAALTLSTILFSVNAFFAWSYLNDRYLAPLPYQAAAPAERAPAEAF